MNIYLFLIIGWKKQMKYLFDEACFQDTEILYRYEGMMHASLEFPEFHQIICFVGRSSIGSTQISGFLISLLSPVLRSAVCGHFLESASKKIVLDDVMREDFERLLNISVGRDRMEENADVWYVMRLAALADRFQMNAVRRSLEDAAIHRLSIGSCAEVLAATACNQASMLYDTSLRALQHVNEAAKVLAAFRLEAVAETSEFGRLDGETLEALLGDDALEAGHEGIVALRAVCCWMLAAVGYGVGREDWRRALAGLRRRHGHRCRRRLQDSVHDERLSALRAKAARAGGGNCVVA